MASDARAQDPRGTTPLRVLRTLDDLNHFRLFHERPGPELPPDARNALVEALASALVADFRSSAQPCPRCARWDCESLKGGECPAERPLKWLPSDPRPPRRTPPKGLPVP